MARRGRQFGETVLEIAHQKLRAAKARFARAPVIGQAPREVYTASCQAIADALASDGFEYARSRASLTRKSSDLGSRISFQSSHYNIAGELVVLIIHAGVTSQRLKSWRAMHPCLMGGHDIVAGGQIGNLVKPESWIRWNLASEDERDDEIADAVAAIHELAYPYFDLFNDIAAVRARLVAEDIPSMGLASALDFVMCFGSRDEVLALAARAFREKVQIQGRYHAALAQYQSHGVPRHISGPYGDVLAAATLMFGLPNLETPDAETIGGTGRWRYADDAPTLKRPKRLSRMEQKNRRALAKAVAAELRTRAKGTGWKTTQGWLFREDDGWFVDARPLMHRADRTLRFELRAKPMSLDPVFWEIADIQGNEKMPLSFRLFGAWTVSIPAANVIEIDEGSLDAARLAEEILQIAQRELEQSRLNRSIESFLEDVQQQHSQLSSRPYLPAIICSLIVLGRRDDARAICVAARAKQEIGGFLVGARNFVDLAIDWLDREGPTKH